MKQTGNGFKLLSLTVVLTLLIGLITVIPVGAANATDDGFSQPNFSGFSLENLPSGWSLERKGTNLSSTNLISIKDGKLNLELKDTDAKGGSNYQTLTRTFDPVTGNATLNLDFTTNFGNGAEAPDNGISEGWFGVPGYFYLTVINAHTAQKLIRVMSSGGTQAFYIRVQDGVSYHMTANINPQSHICSFAFTDGTGADVTRYDPSSYQPETETEYELKPKSGEEVPTSINNVFFRTHSYAKSGKFNIDIQSAELKVKKSGNGFNQLDFSDFSFSNLPDGWALMRSGTNESSTNLMSIKDGKLNLELKDTENKGSGNYQTLTRTFDPVTDVATLNLDFTTNFGNGEEAPVNGTCEKWFGVPGYFYLNVVNAGMAQKLIRVMSWGDEKAFYIIVQDGVSYHMTANINPRSHICSFIFTDGTGADVTRYDPSSYQPETETEYELKPKSGEGVPTSIDNVFFRTSTYAASGKINIDIQSVGVKVQKTVTANVTGNGQVKYGDTVIENGDKILVDTGDDLTLTLAPDEGYEVESVLAEDQPLIVTNDTVTIDSVTQDMNINITFRAIPETEPTIAANGDVISGVSYIPVGSSDPVFSAVLYSNMNFGYNYNIESVGVEIKNEAGLVLPLIVKQIDITSNGKFGVRVYGPGLVSGQVYTMTPYVVASKDGVSKKIEGETKTFQVS